MLDPPGPLQEQVLGRAFARLEAKRGAAGGPTGWTMEMITAAAQASAAARRAILKLVSRMLSGELQRSDVLLGASLIGLQKPGGAGVRPIAVGEAWTRLASLCALISCRI